MVSGNPLVSIIMPTYNSAQFIVAAIQSVRQQTYTNWELIIIDDASRDFTLSYVRSIAKNEDRIKLLTNSKNKGTGYTRNKGTEEAAGEFIAFLDADDLWRPRKLEKQLNFMLSHNLAMTFSSYQFISENGQIQPKVVEALPYLNYKKLLKANYVGNLTGIYNASKIGKFYAPEIRKRQDWALWLEIIKSTGPTKGMLQPLAYYRIQKNNISGNKFSMLSYNYKIYKVILGKSRLRSMWMMLLFLREQLLIKPKQIKTIKSRT